MSKKTRLIILAVCVVLFLVISPYIVLYSMGYKVDFVKMKITATGGIYIETSPTASSITIDSDKNERPGMFSSSVFVQDLMPENHSVLIKKEGYYDYNKILPVQENQVTKLENILLIKQDISFSQLGEKIDYFSITSDGRNILLSGPATKSLGFQYFSLSNINQKKEYSLPLQGAKVLDIKWSDNSNIALIKIQKLSGVSYYAFDQSKASQQLTAVPYLDINSQQISFNPQNLQQLFYVEENTLWSLKNDEVSAIINHLITYKIYNGNILWLSSDGTLSLSDFSGKLLEKMTAKKITINVYNDYEIVTIAGKIFLQQNNALFVYNQENKIFEDFKAPINNYKLLSSPDGENMVYYNGNEIYLYSFLKDAPQNNVKLFSAQSPETISNCFWLNNDYIIFESGNKIIISEIDYRGNINAVEVSKNYGLSADSRNPKIYYNGQDNKVYILNGDALFSSEKLVP